MEVENLLHDIKSSQEFLDLELGALSRHIHEEPTPSQIEAFFRTTVKDCLSNLIQFIPDMQDLQIREFKERSEAFLKGQDSFANIRNEERVLKLKRRNLKSNQLIKMFNSMMRKFGITDLNQEQPAVTPLNYAPESQEFYRQRMKDMRGSFDCFLEKAKESLEFQIEKPELKEIQESVLGDNFMKKNSTVLKEQVYQSGKPFDFCCFPSKSFLLVPNASHNVDVLDKEDCSVVGSLDISQRGMSTCVCIKDLAIVGTTFGQEMFAFDLSSKKRIGAMMVQRQPCSIRQVTENLAIACELHYLELVNISTLQTEFTLHMPPVRFVCTELTHRPKELVFCTTKGLKFAKIRTDRPSLEMSSETYLEKHKIVGATEFKKNKFFLISQEKTYFPIFDRKAKQITAKIANPSNNYLQMNLIQIPFFKKADVPFLFVRDQQFLILVDLVKGKGLRFLPSPYTEETWSYQQCHSDLDDSGRVNIYCTEVLLRSQIKKITLQKEFIPALMDLKYQ